MKRIVRKNTFETNSSSTHSLTIINKKFVSDELPRNSSYIYMLEECELPYGEYSFQYGSETGKARFMLNIIANYFDDMLVYASTESYKALQEIDFETFIKYNQFVWFKEVLEEETGTKFEFVKPEREYFPFYTPICTEYYIDEILDINWSDKEKFKERVKEIVFNKDIIIVDSDLEYGNDVNFSYY